MKIAIIGAGSMGQALSAYLSSKGADFILNTRCEEKCRVINESGITAEGALTGNYKTQATTDLKEAVTGAELIIIMTIANAHKEVAERLKPHLENGQIILVFNSNWGAFQFSKVLAAEVKTKNILIGETNAQIFVGAAKETGKVSFSMKEKIFVSAFDKEKTDKILERTAEFFPQFEKASSVVETTLSTTNPVIHVPITLFNAVRVENAQPFRFYGDGVSHAVVNVILGLDSEKVKIAKALNCPIDDVLTAINSFWKDKHDNMFDALTQNDTYLRSVGPTTFSHRFLTEDVPYGIAPIASLGKLLNIETPFADTVLETINMLLGKNLKESTLDFKQEDISVFKGMQ